MRPEGLCQRYIYIYIISSSLEGIQCDCLCQTAASRCEGLYLKSAWRGIEYAQQNGDIHSAVGHLLISYGSA